MFTRNSGRVDHDLMVNFVQRFASTGCRGAGFVCLPSFMVEEDLKAGKLVRCFSDFETPEAQVNLTFRPATRRISRVAAVVEAAEGLIPKLLAD
ncbi:MAG: hypothetical protein AAFR39_08155 [Pseudomonadota bacterium]